MIDTDYTREIEVVLFNHGEKDLVIKKGHRIAQLILERCETPDVLEVSEIYESYRGGFGSTGLVADDYENACATWADSEAPIEVVVPCRYKTHGSIQKQNWRQYGGK